MLAVGLDKHHHHSLPRERLPQPRLVNVKGALATENQFASSMVKTEAGENHLWMLNLGGRFDEKQDICSVLKCLLDFKVGKEQETHTGATRQHLTRCWK